MGLFERFPYTNFHDLNLTWILNELKTLEHTINEFVSINALKYADPIQWNITTQYEKNTIVIDPLTGTAYISVQPVPSGVNLTNTDYWTVVFDLGSFVTKAAKNFCSRYEEATTLTATFPSSINDWLIWGDTLYYALVNITAGDAYIVDSNIKQFTIEDVIGHIQDLNTTDKSNLVAAINEILQNCGDLDSLSTTDKSNLVAAINEIFTILSNEVTDRKNKPFINVKDFGAVGDGVTDDYQAFQDAISAAASTGSTVIVPDGNYYLSAAPAVTDLTSGDNLNLLLGYDVEFSGPAAGDPNYPTFDGKLLSPVGNKGNRLRGFSYKSYDKSVSPAGNGSTLNSVEWMADTSDDYISITGSMSNGSPVMTVSSTDGIKIGDGIIPVNAITGFPDGSTRQNTARVTAVDPDTNTIEIGFPSANPSAWAGIANSSNWTGASFSTEAFQVRHRYWNVTEFIASLAGSGNRDRIGYGINIVTSSNGNLSYGIELDMDFGASQLGDTDIVHKGVYVLGFGSAQPNCRALQIEHSAANWSEGIKISQAFHGIDINAAGGIIISNTFVNGSNGLSSPPLFGIKTDDISDADLTSILPFIAAEQPINGTTLVYLRRDTDTTPAGMFIDCYNKANDTRLFGVDIEGRIGAKGAYVDDMTANTGLIVALTATNETITGTLTGVDGTFSGTVGIGVCACGTVQTGVLKIADAMFSTGSITPTGYVTIYDVSGTAHQIPCT